MVGRVILKELKVIKKYSRVGKSFEVGTDW